MESPKVSAAAETKKVLESRNWAQFAPNFLAYQLLNPRVSVYSIPIQKGGTMGNLKRTLSFSLAYLMVFNSVSGQYALADSTQFAQGIKTLQGSIDSGTVKPSDAINQFSKSLTDSKTSMADVEAYAKTQMTATQFAAFQNHINESLNGVDPSTLTPAETGDLVGRTLSDLHKEGLYWSGCSDIWTGAAVVVAAIVVGVIAINKSKSISSIQNDYKNKIDDTTNNYNSKINIANNWQTAIPSAVSATQVNLNDDQNSLAYDQANLSRDQFGYNNASTQAQATIYWNDINRDYNNIQADNSAINVDLDTINGLLSQYQTYTANPAQAAIDAQNLATQRNAAILQLQNQEGVDVTNAPSNQALGTKLGIGAGIGAAIGAGFLIYGITNSSDCVD